MTREEAIEILKIYKEESEEDYWVKRAKALEMAIEALSAQNEAMTEEELAEFKKELANAVPERRKGKWQYVTHYGDRYRHCPFCHTERRDDNSTGWNFCSYCGEDMRGNK